MSYATAASRRFHAAARRLSRSSGCEENKAMVRKVLSEQQEGDVSRDQDLVNIENDILVSYDKAFKILSR